MTNCDAIGARKRLNRSSPKKPSAVEMFEHSTVTCKSPDIEPSGASSVTDFVTLLAIVRVPTVGIDAMVS
jgi:hypothetical protein